MAAAIPAAVSAVGGLLGQGGANKAADAAQNAAMAQQSEAHKQFANISGILGKASTSSLAQYDRAIKAQESNLSRQEQLVAQIDPTIIEASQQALKLLRGEQSTTLGPLKAQRDQQRQKLLNSLREQLGPGAETSSAGQQALSRFDSESSNIFAGAQQQALTNLGQTFGQFSSHKPSILSEAQGLAGLGQGRFGMQSQYAQGLQSAGAPLLQTAGAQFTGDAMRGKQQAAMGGSIMGAGLSMMSAGMAGGSGGGGGGFDFGSMFGGGGSSAINPYDKATTGGFLGTNLGASYSPETAKNYGAKAI